jgi:alpha-D-ribose 1-methylphosphonate 5-triphosphate diphosphatase
MSLTNVAFHEMENIPIGERVITNARIVMDNHVLSGTLQIRNGVIIDIAGGAYQGGAAEDWDDDYLLPGLVELHTDNLERHISPRPGVAWPTSAAILAHDNEITGAGITTVLDALRLGDMDEDKGITDRACDIAATIDHMSDAGKLKADHLLHLRCEVSCDNTVNLLHQFRGIKILRLISLMDHTPGQRQFANLDKYREYYSAKLGLSRQGIDAFMAHAKAAQVRNSARHRTEAVRLANSWGVPLASHDDATAAHVMESAADNVVLAEFPTTIEAARECQRRDIQVLAGAPNVLRGKYHSGNVSALALAQAGCLDILSSDYVPYSLLQAPFILSRLVDGYDLPSAVATVSRNPAVAIGLADRGCIAPGYRADLVRVHVDGDIVSARAVFRSGQQIG